MSTNALGGDLFRFPNGATGTLAAATRVTDNGLGNENNSGFRNLAGDSTRLFVGTAGGSNRNGSPSPTMGGWELRRTAG
jgi:hypothetical protein